MQSRVVLGSGYVLALFLTAAAIFLAASPMGVGLIGPASRNIFWLLGLNLVLIVFLLGTVGMNVFALLRAQSYDAGARLHLKFVTLFSLAALVPALVVAIVYGVLVNRGVEDWFSSRVQTVVENSAASYRSFMDEQKRYVQDHVTLMSADLNRAAPALPASPVTFSHFLGQIAADHGFPAVYLIDREGRVLAQATIAPAPGFVLPPQSAFKAADDGDIFVSSNLVRTLFRLKSYPDAYLYLTRPVDKRIVDNLMEAEAALVSYREAAQSRNQRQTIFSLSYAETALLVLVGAVWLGMGAANSISAPVGRLVQAAGRVAGGDLSARVDADSDPEEIAVLSHAFNNMTRDLQQQQAALTKASDDAEQRRQFIETVLAEVSAGVIATNNAGLISASNRQAKILLGFPDAFGPGQSLTVMAPEVAEIADLARLAGHADGDIDLVRDRETRRLRVRASRTGDGLVLTFDDITRLVAAQRNAAWRDVARRIAHEIKNPLTPIQLSAERIRRKFRKDVSPADLETFDRCTDTIVRQVEDIGRMVDEFSSFARMPTPKYADHDTGEILKAAVFAQRVANPGLLFDIMAPASKVMVHADERMLAQALTNILKNAAESVLSRVHAQSEPQGQVTARLAMDHNEVIITVEDNGLGLPEKDRDRLTEPYVTTREKGTGLGLAIVKKILEDHQGELLLADNPAGMGAQVVLKFSAKANIPTARSGAQSGMETH